MTAGNPHLFGVGTGRLLKGEVARRREIAERHDCRFYKTADRHWFATKGPGVPPFSDETARAVMAEVITCVIHMADGRQIETYSVPAAELIVRAECRGGEFVRRGDACYVDGHHVANILPA